MWASGRSGDNVIDTPPYFSSGAKRRKMFLRISLIKKKFTDTPLLFFRKFRGRGGIYHVIPWSGKFSNFLEKIGNKKIIRNWVHVFVFRFQSKKFLSKYLFLISMEQELLSCSLRWSKAVPIAKQIEFDAFWAGKQTKYVPETIQNVKNETN